MECLEPYGSFTDSFMDSSQHKFIESKGGKNKMVTLKETALSYEAQQFKNIADLEAVPLSLEFESETKKNNEGEEYTVKFVRLNGEKYRIPNSVLESMKMILSQKPNTKTGRWIKHQIFSYSSGITFYSC